MISLFEIHLTLVVCLLLVDGKIEPCFQDGVYFTKDGNENWGSSKEPDETFCQGRQEIQADFLFKSLQSLGRCQNATKCTYWVYFKPLKTCYLQSGKGFKYSDPEFISGLKYCDCYDEDVTYNIYDGEKFLSKQDTIEDCRFFNSRFSY